MSNGDDKYRGPLSRFIEPDEQRRPMYDPTDIERMLARYDAVEMEPIQAQAQRPAGMVDFGRGTSITPYTEQGLAERDAAVEAYQQQQTGEMMSSLRSGETQPVRPTNKTQSQRLRDLGTGFRTGEYPDAESMALGMGLESLPGVELVAGARDVAQGIARRDPFLMGVGALSALPLVPAGLRHIKPALDAARLAQNSPVNITRATRDALTPMRSATKQQLLDSAQRGDHLTVRGTGADASVIGAPRDVRNGEDLQRIRDNYDAAVEEGQSGARWYRDWRRGMKEIAPNRGLSREVSQELALTSMQAEPITNLDLALKGRAAISTGTPVPNIRFGFQARKLEAARAAGKDIDLGFKTEPYGTKGDPYRRRKSHFAVHDIWDARAWGYTEVDGKPWDSGLNTSQHAFLDGEAILAAERANARGLGGRTTWTPEEVQASAWVTSKADGYLERFPKLTKQEALDRAKRSYPAFYDRHTGYLTHESVPAEEAAEHLPSLQGDTPEANALREMYQGHPGTTWVDPETGGDALIEGMDFLRRPSLEMRGVYGEQVNPGQAARVFLARSDDATYGRTLSQHERAALNMSESVRAYIDAQSMGAWHFPITGSGVTEAQSNLIRVPFKGMPTVGQTSALNDWARTNGFYLSHTGDGFTLLPGNVEISPENFIQSPRGSDLTTAMKTTKKRGPGFRDQIREMLGDVEVERGVTGGAIDAPGTYTEGGNSAAIYFGDLWETEGSGQATRALLDRMDELRDLAPRTYARLAESPAIRERIGAKLARDVELGPELGGARQDIQNSRQLMEEDWLAGLRSGLQRGVPLPAVGGLGIGTAAYQQSQRQKRRGGEQR